MFYIYRALSALLAPAVRKLVYQRAKIGKEDPNRLNERFGIASKPRPDGNLIWFHAASVGESLSILTLIKTIKEKHPEINILVTTSTLTSAGVMSQKLPDGCQHQFNTLDIPSWVNKFINHWQPNAVFWVEQEIWPNMIKEIYDHGATFYLINASLSQKSFEKWFKIKNSAAKLFSKFSCIFPKSQTDNDRLQKFKLNNLGQIANLKYSTQALDYDKNDLIELKNAIGSRPFWLAASTHNGEESLMEIAHQKILKAHPQALCILVPRHPNRANQISQELILKNQLRTKSKKISKSTQIYIADTMGELGLYYELSDIAFVGGSLVPIGGHNIIEPAKQSCIPVIGPYVANFIDVVNDFKNAHACIQIENTNDLADTIIKHMDDKKELSIIAKNAQKLIDGQTNIIHSYVAIIEKQFGL